MSKTSLGQRNEQMKRQEISSLRQMASAVRLLQQEQLSQTTLNFMEELQTFIFMKDKYIKAEAQFNEEAILGQTYTSIKDDFGVCIFKNGDRYLGYWKNRLMHGMGIYVFKDQDPILKTVYLGEFQQGKFCGIGKLAQFQEGIGTMIYYGNWFDGKKTSSGRYYYENPHTNYIGLWINDMKHGEGKLVFPGGEFTGTWAQDQRQGFGRLKKNQGGLIIIYEGIWQKDDLPNGKVTYYDSNNSQVGKYEGQLLQGKKHGKGIYFWRGATYEGDFADDCIKGEGSIKLGKTIFKGYFKSERNILNIPQMKGTIIYENGDTFDGIVSIKDGHVQRNGGIYNFATGDSAEGEFQDNPKGQLWGRFIYRWKNGQQRQFS